MNHLSSQLNSMFLKILLVLPGIFAAVQTFCQSPLIQFKYSASAIADSLRTGADAVYRLDEGSIEILSAAKYNYKIHNVVTVLNKKAAHHFNHSLGFDKLQKVESVDINIFDSLGLRVASYTKKDFATKSSYDYDLFNDDKILYLQTAHPAYPCTVETSYELRRTGYLHLPSWSIVTNGASVEESNFTVKVPTKLDIRYKMLNTTVQPTVAITDENKVYVWEMKNLSALNEADENGYEGGSNFPSIMLAPNSFVYDGYAGDMKSWKDLGNWNYPLYTDEKGFTSSQTLAIRQLVQDCKTEREKITVLYDHLQNTMRYVSVQLGIGGFKPFPVQYVEEKKYGDCKALTNYMRYMLKAVGIKAYPALINAGSKKPAFNASFPASYFNHVILCVPTATDSIWLECTSKNNRAGILGSFTEDRNALLLTENGGKVIFTPKSNSYNNRLLTKSSITINEDGGSNVSSILRCTGDFWNIFYQVDQYDADTKKGIFTNYLHYKIPQSFVVDQAKDSSEFASFNINLSYDQAFNFKAGSKYFFDQRIHKIFYDEVKMTTRNDDYLFDFPYEKTDTTVYLLPVGMTVESLPAKKEIKNDYVHYTSECIQQPSENKLMVITHLAVKQKIIPANQYKAVAENFSQVVKNENQKIVLIKM